MKKSTSKLLAIGLAFISVSVFSPLSFAGEATGADPAVGNLDSDAVNESYGRDIDALRDWSEYGETIGGRIEGYELSCDVQGDKVGMCGCGETPDSSQEAGIIVSKGFAKVLNNSIAKCVAKACGIPEGASIEGSKVYGCGFQDRRTAGGNISNHASGNAIDLNKIVCPGGDQIAFNLKAGGNSYAMKTYFLINEPIVAWFIFGDLIFPKAHAVDSEKDPNAGSGDATLADAVDPAPEPEDGDPPAGGDATIPACGHATPSAGYNAFLQCWSETLVQVCPEGQGGALSGSQTSGTERTQPDTAKCHHEDHVHFSSCPGTGI